MCVNVLKYGDVLGIMGRLFIGSAGQGMSLSKPHLPKEYPRLHISNYFARIYSSLWFDWVCV